MPLVVLKIYWTGDLKVSSLRASWSDSSCWARWGETSNLVNPPWSVLCVHWFYCQPDLRWRQILSGLTRVKLYVRIEFFQEWKWFPFYQYQSWSISSFEGTHLVCHFQTFVLLVCKSRMRTTPDIGVYWSWWCFIPPSFCLLPWLGVLGEAQ